MMDIGHMTHFIQEMLPAMTKMANSPTQEIHELVTGGTTHIKLIYSIIVELKILIVHFNLLVCALVGMLILLIKVKLKVFFYHVDSHEFKRN
jgi:pantothenate kinase